jgi:hypothetical protein
VDALHFGKRVVLEQRCEAETGNDLGKYGPGLAALCVTRAVARCGPFALTIVCPQRHATDCTICLERRK